MHFSFSLLRIKGLCMFRALIAHPQDALHKRHLVHYVRMMSVGCGTVAVNCNRATTTTSHPYVRPKLIPETSCSFKSGLLFKIILEIFKFSSCTPTPDYKIFKFSNCKPTADHKILVLTHLPVRNTLLRRCFLAYYRYLALRIATRFLSISFPFNCTVESLSISYCQRCHIISALSLAWWMAGYMTTN
jgi:hypothetical protein